MTEGEREKIKHKANFYNGIGLVFMAAVSFGAAFRILHNAPVDVEFWDRAMNWGKFIFVVAFGVLFAFFSHGVGQAYLRKLDEDGTPAKPPASPPRM